MIDFELNEEQQMIREALAAFATEEIRPVARAADESGTISAELVAKAWQLGLVRSAIPEGYGGDGGDRSALTGALVAEELAFGDMSIAVHVLAPRLVAFPVLEMGTAEQRERYLRGFCGGDFVAGSAALVEGRFDFDPSHIETKAHRDGSAFVLHGNKCLVPLARESETILVYAAMDGESNRGEVQGFLLDRDSSGLEAIEREKNMGLKGVATYELALKHCTVEAGRRLGGEEGINFPRLMSEMRVAVGAMGVGMSRGAFEYARDYAKERTAFGVPIATKQAVAFMLADMAIEIDAARLLVWEAAWHLDHGEDGLKESYLARNYVAAAALKITDNAVQVLGGHGYIREHPVEMWLRNARGLATFDAIATV